MKHTAGGIIQRLREVISVRDAAGHSDGDLVRRFASRGDSAAFEAIVRRHGPMVLGVCRRLLRDGADADDAFQATFAILMRKASSLSRPEQLAGWLFQVAYRTARRAGSLRYRRHSHQQPLPEIAVESPIAEIVWRELQPIFDEEVNRLPEKLRLPVVLCFLEGRTKRAAAHSLGWAEGTFSCRLQQARELLRSRLTRRGVTLSVGAMTLALFQGTASAAVPTLLMTTTIHSASLVAAGTALSAPVAALTQGVIQSMFLTKLKVVAALVLAVGILGGGTGLFVNFGSGSGDSAVAAEPGKPSADKKASSGQSGVQSDFSFWFGFNDGVGAEDAPGTAEAKRQRTENEKLKQKVIELTNQIAELQEKLAANRDIEAKVRVEAEEMRRQALKALGDMKAKEKMADTPKTPKAPEKKGDRNNADAKKQLSQQLDKKIAELTSQAENLQLMSREMQDKYEALRKEAALKIDQLKKLQALRSDVSSSSPPGSDAAREKLQSAARQLLAEIEKKQRPDDQGAKETLSRALKFVSAVDAERSLKKVLSGERAMVLISIDERTNTLLISCPPAMMSKVKQFLDQIDAPANATPAIPIGGGESLMKFYTTKLGAAPDIAKKLNEVFPPSATFKIWDVDANHIMVWGTPDDHEKIVKFFADATPKPDVAVEEADVRKAEAELNILLTKLKLRTVQFDRLKNNEGAIPQQQIETAKAAVTEAQAEMNLGKANLVRAQALLERARRASQTKQIPPADSRVTDSELVQLHERLQWSTRMHAKGYLSKTQVDQAAGELQKAMDSWKKGPSNAPGGSTTIAILEDRVARLQQLLKAGDVPEIELDRARLALAEARIAAELETIRDLYKKNPTLK